VESGSDSGVSISTVVNPIVRVLPTTGLVIVLAIGCGAEDQGSTGNSESTISSTSGEPAVSVDTTIPISSSSTSVSASSTTSIPLVTVPETFEDSVTVPAGQIDVGPNDLFIAHADGDLWLHPRILTESPAEAFRIADFGDPRDPVDEGSGPNQVQHVAGVVNRSVIYSYCCEPAAGNVLAATRADSEWINLLFGYTPVFSPDRTRLATANSLALNVVEFSSGVTTGRMHNQSATYLNLSVLIWTDDSSLVLLYLDDSGYALLPIDADSLVESAAPTPLGVAFDPDAPSLVRFAGHGPNGEIGITIADEHER